jgi:hypothetical protein
MTPSRDIGACSKPIPAKLSATYLHNLTTILADRVPFTPAWLNYFIPNESITVHDPLTQKSNGVFELAVWDERTIGADAVTVNLGATVPAVTLYDPTVSVVPMQTLSNVASVQLT